MSKATYENLFGEKYNTNVIFLKNVDLTEAEEDELITNLMSKEGVSSATRISSMMGMIDDTLKSFFIFA